MPNPYFRFKQFTIYHDQCAMKVGTDGVLLGAWVNSHKAQRILDVGTGTGLIALMLAQRNPNSQIDAVEIDAAASKQAQQNVLASNWHNRVSVYHSSLQQYQSPLPYQLIVSNPPYFVQSTKTPSQRRTQARHTDNLSPQDLLIHSCRLLSAKGQLAVILPYHEGLLFKQLAQDTYALHCHHYTQVKTMTYKPITRLLMSFGRAACAAPIVNTLVIGDKRSIGYTPEYLALTNAFYL